MGFVYKVFVWNRKAVAWDYKGDEPLLFDGDSFTDKEKAIEFARQCVKKYDPEVSKIDLSEYYYPDDDGDGEFIRDINFQEVNDERQSRN